MTLAPLKPYPYQKADIDRLVANGGSGLVVTEVGGGKTLVALETALKVLPKSPLGITQGTVMVIAPQGTHVHAWSKTLDRQTGGVQFFRRLETSKKGNEALADLKWGEPGFYICTPQWFARRNWGDVEPDMVIFDEIHMAGAYQNETRKRLHQLAGAKARLGLSGTPLRNKFENAWSIVRWIDPPKVPENYWLWRMSNDLETKYDRFAPQNRIVVGEKVPGKLVNTLSCYIQHLQREACCPFHPRGFVAELPEPAVEIRTVKLTRDQRAFYKQMEESYVAWLSTPDDEGKTPVVAELPIVARSMLRFCALGMPSIRTVTKRFRSKETGEIYEEEREELYFEPDCESPKIDELLNVLREIGDQPALVFTHSQRFAEVVVDRLASNGVSSFEWSSKHSQKQRDKALTAMAKGELRVIVGVISAIGTGTDGLQENCSTEIWLSEDDDATNGQQAKGRLDRPGQRRQVVRIYIQAENTYDQGVMSKNLQKALSMAKSLRKRASD